MLQYIGSRALNNESYSNSAHAKITVSTTAIDAIAARPDRKRLVIVNRSVNTLYVGAGTATGKPATADTAEIEIPGEFEYEFNVVPATAINLIWASNTTPDPLPEALITENW